jgi:hypothetical protein
MKEVKKLEKLENSLFTPLANNEMKSVMGGYGVLKQPTANVTGHSNGTSTQDAPVEDCTAC